jgi:hypothetical protein
MADDYAAKLAAIDQSGANRFGDDWKTACEAIKRQVAPNGGLPPDAMALITSNADPAGLVMNLGRHALMEQASNGDKEAERSYSAMRRKERKAHYEATGRTWEWE